MGSEWKIKSLGEIAENISRPFNFFQHEEVVFINTGDVLEGRFLHNDLVGKNGLPGQAKKRIEKGDILFSEIRPANKRFARVDFDPSGYVVSTKFMVIRLTDPEVDPDYFYTIFTSNPTLEEFQRIAESRSGTFPQITFDAVSYYPLNIPSIPDQKSIAHILGSLDDKIELNRQMNATLESMAQALFKSWFVDFDPVIDNALAAGNPIPEPFQARAKTRKALGDKRKPLPEAVQQQFPSSFVFTEEMGWIPDGWKVQSLKNLTIKIGSGATPRGGSQVYVEEGTSLIRSQNVYDSLFSWDGLVRINEEAAAQLRGVTVHPKDILLNITGASILRTCVVDSQVLPARVNQHVAIIRAKTQIPPRYLHLHLLQEKTKKLLLGQNAGASREAITKGHLESAATLVPDEYLLNHFKLLTEDPYEKMEKLSWETRTLSNVRDTLLPKLLSGQLRIPDAEKLMAGAL